MLGHLILGAFALLLLELLSPTTASIAITGASGGVNISSGQRPARLEIGQFQASGVVWDLYILALAELQQVDIANPLSYYQIAGMCQLPGVAMTDTGQVSMAFPSIPHGMEFHDRPLRRVDSALTPRFCSCRGIGHI